MENAPRYNKQLQRKRREQKRRQLKRQHRQNSPGRTGRRAFLIVAGALMGNWAYRRVGDLVFSPKALQRFRSRLLTSGDNSAADLRQSAIPNAPEPAAQVSTDAIAPPASPVQLERITITGIPLYRTIINLKDPDTFLSIGLANRATKANSGKSSKGDESFKGFVKNYPAAVLTNGTFFSMDAEKRVMGNMVAEGRFLKYSRWENYGTTLGIRADNQVEMVTARTEGKPQWDEHWFSITSGPRLLKQGKLWIAPKSEGFRDPHVLGVGTRMALGFPKGGDKIILATFLRSLSLEQEAKAMRALGCYEAMNFDGGTSVALAHRGKVLLDAQRPLTNVLVVYDAQNPAPQSLKDSWWRFQQGDRPIPTA